MTKWILLSSVFVATFAPTARAVDLMGNPDTCQIERLKKEPYLLGALTRRTVSNVLCWHKEFKLMTAASVLTRLIRNRTATFVDGTGTLDLSVAALTGYKLDSMVRYCDDGHVYIAIMLAGPGEKNVDFISQIYEVSPNHFFGAL